MSIQPPVLTLSEAPAHAASASIRAKALLFHDPRSQALLQQIERVARSDATVLIIGETGTGKELAARHIHHTSERRGPFVAVNCGAFSETLIDAELFGHEAGAYTGASGARAGWFEAAQGGTLFLDEIGDLPMSMQVKLLRVLQERQVVRLGSRKPVPFDVRLLAATNVDLQKAVEAQHFRADLYYRLSVAPLALPPLRERPGDILPLAEHFMALYARRMGLQAVTLAPDASAALQAHAWPGNIRELENVVHFGLIVCKDNVIHTHDLRLGEAAFAGHKGATRPAPTAAAAPSHGTATAMFEALGSLLLRLAESREPRLYHAIESLLVRTVYDYTHNNQVQSARVLGVTRNTLRTLLKRHGLLRDASMDLIPSSASAGEG
jgi:sigma-54-specific transcriptional regulator